MNDFTTLVILPHQKYLSTKQKCFKKFCQFYKVVPGNSRNYSLILSVFTILQGSTKKKEAKIAPNYPLISAYP